MEGKISSIEEVVSNIKSKEVRVKFTKQSDGSTRVMKCTLDFDKIPKERHPKKKTASEAPKEVEKLGLNSTLCVFDLEKMGWRSFKIGSLELIEMDGKTYEVEFEE